MSLFGAKSTFQKAKDRLDKKMKEDEELARSHSISTEKSENVSKSASSGIGAQMIIARDLQDPDGTATTSEIAREDLDESSGKVQQAAVTLTRQQFNQGVRIHNAEVRAAGHPSQQMEPVFGTAPCKEFGIRKSQQYDVHIISSDDSSLSPPPTTSYGGSEISFPSQTPREEAVSPVPTTIYGGSTIAMPPSAFSIDPFLTPRTSGKSILATRYIQSEENINIQVVDSEEEEGGVAETMKISIPIPRKFEISDSDDEVMTEVEWRDEEPYRMLTKKGKKRNKGKRELRPVTPERPIPNMPQTPSRRKLEADWSKPVEAVTNEEGVVNLEAVIGEYLRNTNGLRDFMATNQLHDERYDEWCQKQAEHMAARQNHTDAGVTSIRRSSEKILTKVELSREYDEERADKLD